MKTVANSDIQLKIAIEIGTDHLPVQMHPKLYLQIKPPTNLLLYPKTLQWYKPIYKLIQAMRHIPPTINLKRVTTTLLFASIP